MSEQNTAREQLADLKDKYGLPLTTAAKRLRSINYMRLNRFMRNELDLMPEELAKVERLYNLELEAAAKRESEL